MSASPWNLEPVAGAPLGAVMTGIDLTAPPAGLLDALPSLLAKHGVMVFRDQNLPPEALLDLAGAFGPVEESVLDQFSKPGYPKIYTLSNIIENGRPIGSATDGFGWHTDQGYFERPTAYTFLYGIETPAEGADTVFSTTRRAYDSLPQERQAALRHIMTRHSYMKMMTDRAKKPEFAGKVPMPTEEQRARVPEVVHPLVRRHPVDGGQGLYLGGQTLVEMIGLAPAESDALTKELFILCTAERFQYRHVWRPRDLVVWDNRHTMHRATPYDKERFRRLVWRVSVQGERPVAA